MEAPYAELAPQINIAVGVLSGLLIWILWVYEEKPPAFPAVVLLFVGLFCGGMAGVIVNLIIL